MIASLLFDIGNVLVTFDFSRAMARFAEQSPLSPATIRERLTPLIEQMECGLITSAEFMSQAIAATQFHGPEDAFRTAYCDIFAENAPMVARVARLAGKVPLYLLSNTSSLHLEFLEAAFPVFAHFSGGVFSHVAKAAKPSPEIFRRAIADCRLDPATTLYLDDAPANTAAGAALGLRTFTYDFKNHGAFESELAELGLG
jgi:HAD superfamily hydrolase (TIGR01509 family)